ncbi:WGR domain-containing protein [Novosphingopyxis baekryungensis]|uniref:WGR domain-containing protein n=1 Tax=Novosphingopyxis baekryungensis TaxID=279369 RepID=UPI001B7F9441|nr:WGR domain-containing protein [Novosphingopyxis baekryungensis]
MSLTDLAECPTILLAAIDPDRNCDRRYRIERSVDLFGHHIVELCWGRAGCRERRRCLSVPDEARAVRLVRAVLARRSTAPGRIGVAYRALNS